MQRSGSGEVWRLGTRGSPLALAQANQVRDVVIAANGLEPDAVEIVVIRTSGDRIQDRPLSEAGGKGLFTKEIEEALLDGTIDFAVHSAKDMPTLLPPGLVLTAYLPREDPRDVFIARAGVTLGSLPAGAVVGTASLRRQAMVLHRRPDLRVVNFRGNVQSRLRKLEAGEVDATLLALAGLKRLGLTEIGGAILSTDEFLPAVGQGAITIEARDDDARTRELLALVNDAPTCAAVEAERAYLAVLEGSCRTPIGGFAVVSGDAVTFRGMILRPDGSQVFEAQRAGAVAEANAMAVEAAQELRARAPADFFAAV